MRAYWIKTILPLFTLITCIFGVMYVAIQQDIRMSANDPQIQIAQDTAHQLSRNQSINIPSTISLSDSLASFIILFDKQGNPISSSAQLNGAIPTLPSGVFVYLHTHAEDRFTWQPDTNVRIAAVVVPYHNGYILAGRSLREVENRESQLLYQVFLGWIVTLVATAISVLVVSLIFPKIK